jgi:hypothetical protein
MMALSDSLWKHEMVGAMDIDMLETQRRALLYVLLSSLLSAVAQLVQCILDIPGVPQDDHCLICSVFLTEEPLIQPMRTRLDGILPLLSFLTTWRHAHVCRLKRSGILDEMISELVDAPKTYEDHLQ